MYNTIMNAKPTAPTIAEYTGIQKAYDFFNEQLFSGTLPDVLVTLQRKPKMRGYFWAEQFTPRAGADQTAHELALNPDAFIGRTDEQILSTLVHEMAHVWQHCHGTPPRKCYHDKQWAAKMKALGLQPSATGEPGGKETGQHMTHYVIAGGPFQRAYEALQKIGYRLNYQSNPMPAATGKDTKKPTRQKFTCPECGLNAWAKPEAQLLCGDCSEPRHLVEMEPAD